MLLETVQALLTHLEAEMPAIPDRPTTADLAPWRDRIDAIDRTVIQLLNERAICANVIGAIKKKMDLPVYVPSREEEVLRNVIRSNRGPLPDAAVRRLYERVIDETRSLERQKYQDHSEDPSTP